MISEGLIHSVKKKLSLNNPGVKSLEINSFNNNKYYRSITGFGFEPFAAFE